MSLSSIFKRSNDVDFNYRLQPFFKCHANTFEEWCPVIKYIDLKVLVYLRGRYSGLMAEVNQRYIVAFISFLAVSVQYMIRVNLSVTIQAMVMSKEIQKTSVFSNMSPSNNVSSLKILFTRREPRSYWQVDWGQSDIMKVHISTTVGYISTLVLAGYASERWGARYFCGIALLITGMLSMIAPSAAVAGLPIFMVQRVAVGATTGVILPSVNSIVAKWLPIKERSRLSSLIFSAPSFGSLVAHGVGGYLLEHFNWSVPFYFFGTIAVIMSIPWMIFIYDSPSQHPQISEKEKLYILQGLGGKVKEEKVVYPVPWCSLLTSLPLWAAIVYHMGHAWVVYVIKYETPNYLINMMQLGFRKCGTFSAVPFFFTIISAVSCGFLSQWLRNKELLSHLAAYRVFNGIAVIGSAGAFLCIATVRCDATVVMLLMVIAMTACGAMFGGSCVNHMDLARNFAGTISGLLYTCITVPGILAPLTVGILTNNQHTYTQWSKVFGITAAISVGTYIIYLLFGSVEEQPWNVPQQQRATIRNTGQASTQQSS